MKHIAKKKYLLRCLEQHPNCDIAIVDIGVFHVRLPRKNIPVSNTNMDSPFIVVYDIDQHRNWTFAVDDICSCIKSAKQFDANCRRYADDCDVSAPRF